MHDVLAPGGWLVTQEYSVAGSRRSVALWSLVCWAIVIPLSLVLTRRTKLYRYLWRSVLRFDAVARFEARLARRRLRGRVGHQRRRVAERHPAHLRGAPAAGLVNGRTS